MTGFLNKKLTLVIFTLLIIDKALSSDDESAKKVQTTTTGTTTTTRKPETTTSVVPIRSRCVDGCGCPLFNRNVCGFNGKCFQTFRSKCELRETNRNLLKQEPRFRIVSKQKCETNPCYTPLCESCPIICTKDYKPVCSYSCTNKCYKTFSNSCTLKAWNCQNINDNYIFKRDGECGRDLILCKH